MFRHLIVFLVFFSFIATKSIQAQNATQFTAAAWSPTGKYIAASGNRGVLRIWDENGNWLSDLIADAYPSLDILAWKPDGTQLAAAGSDGSIRIWFIQDPEGSAPSQYQFGELIAVLEGHSTRVYDLKWSPDATKLASVSYSPYDLYTVAIWDTTSYGLAQQMSYGNNTTVAWSPDGTEILVGGEYGAIVFSVAAFLSDGREGFFTTRHALKGHPTASSAWQGDGSSSLIALTETGKISIFDGETLTLVQEFLFEEDFYSAISFSADMNRIATANESDRTVEIRSVETGSLLGSYPLLKDSLTIGLGWSPNDRQVVYGDLDTIEIVEAPMICDLQVTTVEDISTLIQSANSQGTPTSICLPLSASEILTTASNGENGLPIITGDIIIEGNGATLTRDEAADLFRFFEVAPGGLLTLNNLTLSNGEVDAQGGAILNNGTLVINDSTLEGNFAGEHGGAIYNTGTLTIANTAFSDNHTNRYAGVGEITLPYGYGGAIENSTGATATLNGSTFDGNGSDYGAAIANAGTLTIEASTFTGNLVSSSGGAIYNTGTLTSQSNTLDNNQAGTGPWSGGSGGALANTGTATLTDDIITFNVAKFGGGILNSGSLTLTDTLVNDNSTNSSDGGSSGGGGLLNNGASGNVTITGGEFQHNTAIGRGGGIYNAFSGNTVTINGAIIADNYATVTGGGPGQVLAYGGGIASYGTLNMTNTRLENNTADTQGGGIHATNVWIVHQSCINGNSTTSIYISGLSQNPSNSFTNNWWGAANGPSGSGSGSGDSTNLGNRSYIPYLTTGCPLP
ncbi:MAG: hypothetical protein H6673_15755 [Anaerolineales bacterium]|nr:hypothetical protein [Anaerolineales bacterium]